MTETESRTTNDVFEIFNILQDPRPLQRNSLEFPSLMDRDQIIVTFIIANY